MITLIIAILLFVAYNVVLIAKYSVPQSLSATYYTDVGRRWLVPLLGILCILLGIAGFNGVKTGTEWTVFLSIAGLAFVAATPLSRDDYQGRIHLGAALVSAAGTQALVITNASQYLYIWLLLLPLWWWRSRAVVYWAEIICFATLIMALA